MTTTQHKLKRRSVINLLFGVLFTAGVGTSTADELVEADDIVLKEGDIPWADHHTENDIETSSFIEELAEYGEDTYDAESVATFHHRYDQHWLVASVGSFVLIYQDGTPQSKTIYRAMNEAFKNFPQEMAGSKHRIVTRRVDSKGAEWRLVIPDFDWHWDATYVDVTRLEVLDNTVLGTVVYGPDTSEWDPPTLAKQYSAEMRRRALNGE